MIRQVWYFYVLHKCVSIANANIKVMKFNYVERNLKNKHMSVTALRNKSVENWWADGNKGYEDGEANEITFSLLQDQSHAETYAEMQIQNVRRGSCSTPNPSLSFIFHQPYGSLFFTSFTICSNFPLQTATAVPLHVCALFNTPVQNDSATQ